MYHVVAGQILKIEKATKKSHFWISFTFTPFVKLDKAQGFACYFRHCETFLKIFNFEGYPFEYFPALKFSRI